MGGCPNYGPFLNTLNIGCRIIIGIQKGTMIDNHPYGGLPKLGLRFQDLGFRVWGLWEFPKLGVPQTTE